MKRIQIIIWIFSILIFSSNCFGKIKLVKNTNKKIKKIEEHPAGNLLNKARNRKNLRRDPLASDTVLVLLIDFQEEIEDDPNTTGNGKFIMEHNWDEYPITVGAPPHDKAYFDSLLIAAKHYYLAASYGMKDISFDVFPKNQTAYTLPNQMGYYNPPNASNDLFIERVEKYFADAFAVADQDPLISFKNYHHFILIHAGADWQHDIYSDSPSDLPTMHVEFGDQALIEVDEGETVIEFAINVPETISQDDQFGVPTNGIVHELGHSLGLVDLYNTRNFYPGVGWWDIMDAGGSVSLGFEDNDYAVEGAVPGLPGAWSRLLLWSEDFYRAHGMIKDISEIRFDHEIQLRAAELPYKPGNSLYIVKIPLNDHEYILIENRQVDPDHDGGTYFQGGYPLTPGEDDYRVILYPTPVSNNDNRPTYEYDFILPGWITSQGVSLGGGLVMWHIDDSIIDQEGIDSNNFANNQVNGDYYNRGVKIIEADNLADIGNPDSYFWQGTEYESFFKYKPNLDWDSTHFTDTVTVWESWSEEIFSDEYSSTSSPTFQSNEGFPSMYRIYDISSIDSVMTFKIGLNVYDKAIQHIVPDDLIATGFLATDKNSLKSVIPIASDHKLKFYEISDDNWQDIAEVNYDEPTEIPIMSNATEVFDNPTFTIVNGKEVTILNLYGDSTNFKFDTEISDAPMIWGNNDLFHTAIATSDTFYVKSKKEPYKYPIKNAKICYSGDHIFALEADKLYDITEWKAHKSPNEIELPGTFTKYYPVSFKSESRFLPDYLYLQSDMGIIYQWDGKNLEEIFDISNYTSELPTQLSLGSDPLTNQPFISFGADNLVFAITTSGALIDNFPVELEDKTIVAESDPFIVLFNELPIMYFKTYNNGYIASSIEAQYFNAYSYSWDSKDLLNQFFWDSDLERLYFVYSDNNNCVYAAFKENITENPIQWNGFKNGGYSSYLVPGEYDIEDSKPFRVIAYPNPATSKDFRFRVEGYSDLIEVKLFDIAGNLICEKNTEIDTYDADYKEIVVNIDKFSSGVYFGIVSSNGKTKRVPVVIEK